MFARIIAQVASASPRKGQTAENRQSMSLAAFRVRMKIPSSRYPIFLISRFASMRRICDNKARASCSSISPTDGRSGCLLWEVVSGMTKQVCLLIPFKMITGREHSLFAPSCSKPIFTPREHHQISRAWKKGASMRLCISFFFLFHLSKSFFISVIL